jgi:hypothetical protein
MTTPYVPQIAQSTMRILYTSKAQVLRLQATLESGSATVVWTPVTDILDPYLMEPGRFMCQLDLQFTRPGKDQPMPLVAGRSPDRVGVLFFDPVTDKDGFPLILAGDRINMVEGPIRGTFEIRVIPEVAQDLLGAHHIETQVIEVSQATKPGSVTPFPGSPA